MPRPGRLIEVWKDTKYRNEAEIRLHTKSGVFEADFHGTMVKSKSLEDIRHQLSQLSETEAELDWIPVLKITCSGTFANMTDDDDERSKAGRTGGSSNISIEFERSWMARKPDGMWFHCDCWDSTDKVTTPIVEKDERLVVDRRASCRQFHWDVKRRGEFRVPMSYNNQEASWEDPGVTHYIRYTPELWLALHDLVAKMEKIQEKLGDLLGQEEGRARLVLNFENGMKALTAGANGRNDT